MISITLIVLGWLFGKGFFIGAIVWGTLGILGCFGKMCELSKDYKNKKENILVKIDTHDLVMDLRYYSAIVGISVIKLIM